jgi:hypothetical protein
MHVCMYIYIYVHRHDILRRPQLFKVKSDLEEPLQKLLEGLEQAADTVNVGDRRLMVPKCWENGDPPKNGFHMFDIP